MYLMMNDHNEDKYNYHMSGKKAKATGTAVGLLNCLLPYRY